MHHLSPLVIDWTSFFHVKSFLLEPVILCWTRHHSPNFSVNVNSILSLTQMKIANQQQFWAAMSRIIVCFCHFFSRCLFKHFEPRLRRKKWLIDTSLCCLVYSTINLWLVFCGWLSTRSSTVIIFLSSCALSFAVAVLQLVQFLKIYISQGSVATRFVCGEIFNDNFIAELFIECASEKKFWKLINA